VGWELQLLGGFAAGLVIAFLTSPVGVSGAVFLLPVQMDVLQVANPSVTPTNLLYNVVSGPGALLRYWTQGQRPGVLARYLLAGTVPGVVIGALIRVYAIPDAGTFRLVAAVVLLPVGVWLILRAFHSPHRQAGNEPSTAFLVGTSLVVGMVGGVYGIGGGSVLAPILVARGLSVAQVAPAALASTFVTSIVGAIAFGLLAMRVEGSIAPDWLLGFACGAGGLVGGYLGARWQRQLPERWLTIMLGIVATGLGATYVAQALR
jgi:uncharacterized membrane protein YfcA